MASQSDVAQVSTQATQTEGRGTKRRACCGYLERQALKVCSHCGVSSSAGHYCSGCKSESGAWKSYVHYCSRSCQQAHWPYHKDFCASGRAVERRAQPCLKAGRTENDENADVGMIG